MFLRADFGDQNYKRENKSYTGLFLNMTAL